MNIFVESFQEEQKKNFEVSKAHGFEEDDKYNFGEKVALMHAELSEGIEWFRHGNPASDHIPQFSGIEEEYADTIIRIMNDAQRHGYRLAEAIQAKREFNSNRPFKHGGKAF